MKTILFNHDVLTKNREASPDALMSSNETDINVNAKQDFVNVSIVEKKTNITVGKYPVPLINDRYTTHLETWLDDGWKSAVVDGVVEDDQRSRYQLNLHGSLSVNEVIDSARILNGTIISVRGYLVLNFERNILINGPSSQCRSWLPPSNIDPRPRFRGSEAWVNIEKLGYNRDDLADWSGQWVSISGIVRAATPPYESIRWYTPFLSWWKYAETDPRFVGVGHGGLYAVELDVQKIINLRPKVSSLFATHSTEP